MEKSPKKDFRSANNAFHKTKIHWAAICVCGFHEEPDIHKLACILQEHGMEIKEMETTCSTVDESAKDYYYYVYVDFQPFFWTEELIAEIQTAVRQELSRPLEELHVVHKHSMVDQVFLGGLHPFLKEKDLVALFSGFGTLINVEVKRRSNGRSRCFGFATFLNSRESVLELIDKRYIASGSDHIEIKSIGNGKAVNTQKEAHPMEGQMKHGHRSPGMMPNQNQQSMQYPPFMMQPFMMMPNGMMCVPTNQMMAQNGVMQPQQQQMMMPQNPHSMQQMMQQMNQMMGQFQMMAHQAQAMQTSERSEKQQPVFSVMEPYNSGSLENNSSCSTPDSIGLGNAMSQPFNLFGPTDDEEGELGLESVFARNLNLNNNQL